MPSRWLLLLTVLITWCLAATGLAVQATDSTNIDSRWYRSVPAGPFSEVSTAFGTLQTSIPIFHLEGRGGSGMSFSIFGRSNTGNQPYANLPGGAGAGWTTSGFESVDMESPRYVQYKMGNSSSSWRCWGDFGAAQRVWTREPGTRADVIEYGNLSQGVSKVEIKEVTDKSVWCYDKSYAGIGIPKFKLGHVTDAYGNTVTYSYDTSWRLTQMVDASGRTATFTYDSAKGGQLSQVSLVAGSQTRTWNFNYNAYGTTWLLASIDFPRMDDNNSSRPQVSFNYSADLLSLIGMYDFNNSYYAFTYGTSTFHTGQVVKTIQTPLDANGGSPSIPNNSHLTQLDWKDYPSLTNTYACEITDEYGNTRRDVYIKSNPTQNNDPNYLFMANHIVRVQDAPTYRSDTQSYWTWYESFSWDYADCTLTQYVDREGHPTDFTYYAGSPGLLQRKRVWRNSTSYYDWNYTYANYLPVTEVDPVGTRIRYDYDPGTAQVVQKTVDLVLNPSDISYTSPSGQYLVTHYAYQAANTGAGAGELTDEWTGSDPHTTYGNFDTYGNPRTITPPSGNATLVTYDGFNNKLSVQEPAPGGLTTFAYDYYNRVLQTNYPDGKHASAAYDLSGNVMQTIDERGVVTNMAYGVMNKLLSTTVVRAAGNVTTSYTYDVRGDKGTMTNPNGETTAYYYDERDKFRQVSYSDGTNRKVEYDGNGNVTYRRNGRMATGMAVISMTYDWLGELTNVNYPSANTPDVAYTYRADGLRATMVDGTGTTSYGYDAAKRPTTVTQGLTGKTVTTTYDASGRKKTLAAGTMTWTYNYDSALRLGSINQTVGAATPAAFAYYANGAVQYREGEANMRTWFGYDNRGRTKWISHRQGALASETEKQKLEYTYDNSGFPTLLTDTLGTAVTSTAYTHDELGRLTHEIRTGAAAGNFDTGYNYDGAGNRTSVAHTVSGTTTTSSYTKYSNDRFHTGDGYTAESYDNDGNPLSLIVPATAKIPSPMTEPMVYDDESRLISLTVPAHTEVPGGSVPLKTITFKYDGDGQRVERIGAADYRYLYDGSTEVALLDAGNNFSRFTLPGVGYVAGTVQRTEQEDATGAVACTRYSSGNEVSRQTYDAFGNETVLMQGSRSDHRWGGKSGYDTDDDTGLVMMGARYYVPGLGRFLTQDPIGQQGGMNLYAYCGNSPLNKVDPTGEQNTLIVYGSQGGDGPEDDPNIRAYSDRIAFKYESAGGPNDSFMRVDTSEDALKYAKWADRLVWIGHADNGNLYMDDGGPLTASDFSDARNHRRLLSVDLVGCDTLVDSDRAAAWSRLCDGNLKGTYSSLPINLFSYNVWPFNGLAKYSANKKNYRGLFPGFNWKGKKGHHQQ